jgi:hypothetical protein
MSDKYYREKIMKLVEKLFTHEGNVKNKFIEYEELIFSTYLISKNNTLNSETTIKWDAIWKELNIKSELNLGNRYYSSFYNTVKSKRNKSLIKYLDFFLEEFYRVI